MQTYIVLIACVILLLCLFFRVPVYISVFAAGQTRRGGIEAGGYRSVESALFPYPP